MTCRCAACPAKDTPKCPKVELESRAYYFRELLNKQRRGGIPAAPEQKKGTNQ